MRLFKRKTKPPLLDAIRMVNDATEIAYIYLRDHKYSLSEDELRQFDKFANILWQSHCTAQYIARAMRKRTQGKFGL